MNITENLSRLKYVADANGNKTDILVPIALWEALLNSLQQTIECIEDREDIALFEEWLKLKKMGDVETISLDDLEQELMADGLV